MFKRSSQQASCSFNHTQPSTRTEDCSIVPSRRELVSQESRRKTLLFPRHMIYLLTETSKGAGHLHSASLQPYFIPPLHTSRAKQDQPHCGGQRCGSLPCPCTSNRREEPGTGQNSTVTQLKASMEPWCKQEHCSLARSTFGERIYRGSYMILDEFKTCLDAVLCSLLWVTLLGQGVGLGDPQRALPTPTSL